MTFNSFIFILLFLPVFLLLYYSLGRFGSAIRKGIIILGSIVFYLYAGPEHLVVLGGSIAINLCMIILLLKVSGATIKKLLLAAAILLNVLLLIYFKYFNFLAEIINYFSAYKISGHDLIFPLGISFFTFQQIMYIVSIWKGDIHDINIPDYLSYVLFFPKISIGPLMEPVDFLTQVNDPGQEKISFLNIAGGLKLFSIGLFKKMVLADTFARVVDWGFAGKITDVTAMDLFVIMLFYTFQIYFDFSGYSDMAGGVSKMMNITLPMNFDSPYKALSIHSFWKKWHISLTDFLTKYIYIPLGGSRKGVHRTCVNILIVYLISGIWHGSNLTFILWGCLHGMLQILERFFQKSLSKLPRVIRWCGTFVSVNLLWLLFRADSISQWWNMVMKMFRLQDLSLSRELLGTIVPRGQNQIFESFGLAQSATNGVSLILFLSAGFLICLIPESAYKNSEKLTWFNMIGCAFLFLCGFLLLSTETVFVYWNF